MPAEPTRIPAFRRLTSRRIVVADESMAPTLHAGDRLLLDPRAYRRRAPRIGDVVVLVDPEDSARWLIKRVVAVDRRQRAVDVRGDAVAVARDSRRFGLVPLERIVGRAYRLYFPPDRRREL